MKTIDSLLQFIAGRIVSESGSGYLRFANGIQICWARTTQSVAINTAYGSNLFIGSWTWTYPKAFVGSPACFVGFCKWGTSASWGSISDSNSSQATVRAYDIASRAAGDTLISVFAIGAWK